MNQQELVSQDMSKLSPQQVYTLLTALVTLGVTQLVAFVPSLDNLQQNLISAGGFVVTVGILLAGAIHHFAQAHTTRAKVVSVQPSVTADRLRAQLIAAGHTPEA